MDLPRGIAPTRDHGFEAEASIGTDKINLGPTRISAGRLEGVGLALAILKLNYEGGGHHFARGVQPQTVSSQPHSGVGAPGRTAPLNSFAHNIRQLNDACSYRLTPNDFRQTTIPRGKRNKLPFN